LAGPRLMVSSTVMVPRFALALDLGGIRLDFRSRGPARRPPPGLREDRQHEEHAFSDLAKTIAGLFSPRFPRIRRANSWRRFCCSLSPSRSVSAL
jgi:hypothetical protein